MTGNIADILTKVLPWDIIHKFVYWMGLNPRVMSMSVQEKYWYGLTHKGLISIVLLKHTILLLTETQHILIDVK